MDKLLPLVDRLDAESGFVPGGEDTSRFRVVPDFVGRDELFLELIDWHKTFPKVWGILGWHIQLYLSHVSVTPSIPVEEIDTNKRLVWHQDSTRLNIDLESDPRPRISLKVGYFLTDTTDPDRGNFHVIPGSHVRNRLPIPDPDHEDALPGFTDDGVSDPDGAVPICVPAGTAVLFDRRLWHAAGINRSGITRRALFYGYSYRWLRPRDDMTVEHVIDRCDPIRQQLLGKSTGGLGYTSPKDEDVPLRSWIREHVGEDAVAP